ncbi:MAG TPA: DinB family protein [Terriglobales bacterium]|nr:DinB family protein [Terriglobales bacterium]
MKRVLVVLALLLSSAAALGQSKNPVSDVIRQILPRRQKNMIAAAELMPADKYSFKPTADQMTFAHLIMHVAESNNFLCARVSNSEAPKSAKLNETDDKEKLVAALKASFDFCASALSKDDDSKLGDTVELFGGQQATHAFALFAISNDWADHYAAEAQYLRLNGILPPSAQKK